MSTTTPYFGWPVPAGTDADDVPYWMQQALVAIENSLKAPPMAKATQTGTGQSLTSGVYTDVLFNTEDWDNGNLHSTTTNTSRITVTKAGVYLVHAGVTYASNATGIRKASILKNGTTTIVLDSRGAISGSTTSQVLSGEIALAVGDYVILQAYQNSGGALALDTSAGSTWMSARWVSA